MPVVQFHCPHCGGLFQIDESLSGQHVSCPLCASVVAIPELAPPPAGFPPPPPPESDPYPPAPASEEAFQLGCPICSGAFQVTRSMGGQQVACPHCNNAVLLPDFEGPSPTAPEPPAADWAEPPQADPTPAPASAYIAPTPAPPEWSSPSAEPHSQDVPARFEAPEDLLPPAAAKEEKSPQRTAPVPEEKSESLLPPAAKSKTPKQSARQPSKQVEELLPPAAAKTKATAASKSASPADELLPPAAGKRQDAKSKQLKDEEEPNRSGRSGVAADGSILVPTDDGRYIALREPVKTIAKHGQEIELRRLSPEEKAQRRFKRNLFVATFGLLFLIVTMLVMAYLNGAF
jgi:hypothetical protein